MDEVSTTGGTAEYELRRAPGDAETPEQQAEAASTLSQSSSALTTSSSSSPAWGVKR